MFPYLLSIRIIEEVGPVRVGLHAAQYEHLPQTQLHDLVCDVDAHLILRIEELVQRHAVYQLRRDHFRSAELIWLGESQF